MEQSWLILYPIVTWICPQEDSWQLSSHHCETGGSTITLPSWFWIKGITAGHEYLTEDELKTEQLEDNSTLQALAKDKTSMRGLTRIAGRNSTIPAASITTLDATGYKGLLPGKESCILVKPLGDQTPHGLIIASTLSSFHGKHVKVQEMWDNNMSGFTHESELALCVQFPVSRKTTGTSASHNSLSVKLSFTTKMKKLQSTNSPL